MAAGALAWGVRRSRTLDPAGGALAAAAVLAAGVVGIAMAVGIPFGVGLLAAACFTPLVFVSFATAVAVWIPLVFLQGIDAFNVGAKATAPLLVVGWLASVYAGRVSKSALRRQRHLLQAFVVLLCWLTLSLAWAPDLARARESVWQWWVVAAIFLVVATCATDERALRLIVTGMVAGSVAAVLAGLSSGGLSASATRLEGGAGDPNSLAAGLLPAIVIAGGAAAAYRGPLRRWSMVSALVLLAAGVVLSQSRGAALAALLTVVVALVVFKRRRAQVAGLTLVAAAVAAVTFSLVPGAWERITTIEQGGGPRKDLWTVAWRVADDHVLLGVGTNNFATVEGDYVREPGALRHVHLIAERPKAAHNLYLQLLAENGIPGLTLFLVVAGACMLAAWRAALRCAAAGRRDLETLSRAVVVAQASILAAALFLSLQVDIRLWVTLALGPLTLEVASRLWRETSAQEPPTPALAARPRA